MTLPLNTPRRNDAGALEQRIRYLEQALRQIDCRPSGRASNTPITVTVHQVAHGFSIDQVVRPGDGSSTWYLAIADRGTGVVATTLGDHSTGIITRVLGADDFVVTLWGPAQLASVPSANYKLYVVSQSTPGAYVEWDSITLDGYVDRFLQGVFYHLTGGQVIVLGPEHRQTHSHKIIDIRDVQGVPGTDGSALMWDHSGALGLPLRATWVIANRMQGAIGANLIYSGPASGAPDWPTFRTPVPADYPAFPTFAGPFGDSTHIPVISVDATGRITVLTQVAAAAGGSGIPDPGGESDLDFLRWDAGSSSWLNYSMGDIAYDVTKDRIDFTATLLGIDATSHIDIFQGGQLRWLVRGTEAGGTDKWAIAVGGSDEVSFQDDGTEVAKWKTSATAGNRKWQWKMDVEWVGKHLTIDGTSDLRFVYDGTPHYASWISDTGTPGFRLEDNGHVVARYTANATTAASRKWTWSMPMCFDNGLGDVWQMEIDSSADLLFGLNGTNLATFSSLAAFFHSNIDLATGKFFFFRGGSGAWLVDDGSVNGILLGGNFRATTGAGLGGRIRADVGFDVNGTDGITATAVLAKLTLGGSNGSLTIVGGIITAYTAPT